MEPDTESKAAKTEHNDYYYYNYHLLFFSRPARPKDQSSMQQHGPTKGFEKSAEDYGLVISVHSFPCPRKVVDRSSNKPAW